MPDSEHLTARRIREFAQFLRNHKYTADTSALLDAQTAAASGYLADPLLLRDGLRACFCQTPGEWHYFDVLFETFWRSESYSVEQADTDPPPAPPQAGQNNSSQRLLGLGGASQDEQANTDLMGAGDYKALSLADFRFLFNPAEKVQVGLLVEALARRARRQFFRRQQIARKGQQVACGPTLQRAIGTKGLPLHLYHRRRRRRLPKFVLLLDISQSMDVYAKFFLRFMTRLMAIFTRSEAFVFNIELRYIGAGQRQLSEESIEGLMNAQSKGWLGGTRIAESFRDFNANHLRRCVDARTTVLVFSDGYDTAQPGELVQPVREIRRRCKRLIWVNPLLGRMDSDQVDLNMDPIVPLLDAYLSAHNLVTLKQLQRELLR